MRTFRVEVGALTEEHVLAIDLPVVVAALLRETGACTVNILNEDPT
jgi:hypothetical protein